MAEYTYPTDRLVTVFGGSGFVGRHVVRVLAQQGWRVRVAVRRPDLAWFLRPLGAVGQVEPVQANLRYPDSIKTALAGASAVVNATGIKSQSGKQSYDAVHVAGTAAIGRAAAAAGIGALVHVSGIGADPASHNAYIASKGQGEAAVREAFPNAVILRPSTVFGPDDQFFNRFAVLACSLPAIPLFGGGMTKLQPVFAGDVGLATAHVLDTPATFGKTYELGGPDVMTLKEAVERTLRTIERERTLVAVPFAISRLLASVTQVASAVSLGKFPQALTASPDEIELLRSDNVVSPAAIAEKRTLRDLGVTPQGVEAILESYLYRFRKTGQYASSRTA
ncbi:MAG: complex I NDUFA9 subunit family protein [Hyphomicrobiales bacterium]|nr:complex I NDUFA9 subunit family protein [Hyphomicrobiales bacterium]